MIIRRNKRVKEKIRWFQILTCLYEIAAPNIRAFTELKFQAHGELVEDLEMVEQNTRVLRQLLTVIKNMPEPPEDQLRRTKKEFAIALSNCINVNTALADYIQLDENGTDGQKQVHSLIISLVLAREYAESTYKHLNLSLEQ
jgi:hypothetical protein